MGPYAKLRHFLRRYERRIIVTSGIILLSAYVVGQFIPGANDLLVTRGVIGFFTLLVVVEIAAAVDEFRESRRVHLSRDQDEDTEWLLDHIHDMTIRDADLIECSSQHAAILLRKLKDRRAKIRLLLKHPDDYADRPAQQEQIRVRIRTLFDVEFADASDLIEVRCYRRPPTLRGRRLGNSVMNVGWYTPDVFSPEHAVRGHTNPLVTAPLHSVEGQQLRRMFDEVFEGLWSDPETVDARDVRSSWAPPPGGAVHSVGEKHSTG